MMEMTIKSDSYKFLITWFLIIICSIVPSFGEEIKVTVAPTNSFIFDENDFFSLSNKYPMLMYKNLEYIPVTDGYLTRIGMKMDFESNGEISIISTPLLKTSPYVTGSRDYQEGEELNASITNKKLLINYKEPTNLINEYPIIKYENISYVPFYLNFILESNVPNNLWEVFDDQTLPFTFYSYDFINEEPSKSNPEVKIESESIKEWMRYHYIFSEKSFVLKSDVINVEKIDLDDAFTTDIEELIKFPNLKDININNFDTSVEVDLSVLGKLKKIESLKLKSLVTNYDELPKIEDLALLKIDDFYAENIDFVTKYPDLKYLEISDGYVGDISPVSKLDKLETFISNRSGIGNIDAIKTLKNLRVVNMSANDISDISVLSYLSKLEEISFNTCMISDISDLKNLENVRVLNIGCNRVMSIDCLSDYKLLEEVNFRGSEFTNIQALTSSKYIKSLNLRGSKVDDLSGISEFKDLRELIITHSSLKDISELSHLDNLEKVDFSVCMIDDISPLKDMMKLEELIMTNNQLSDISILSKLKNLKKISISGNQVETLPNMDLLTKLEWFDVAHNNIVDITPCLILNRLTIVPYQETIL